MTDVRKTVKKSIGKKTGLVDKSLTERKEKNRRMLIARLGIKRKVTRGGMKKCAKKGSKRGVVYIGHLPHGFYEEELKGFFSQFGTVKRVKVSRSPRTGRSKGYAFIEFEFDDVAKIVAETMNNYLMFERLVKAQYIPPEKVSPLMFPKVDITQECYPRLVRRTLLKERQEEPATEKDLAKHKQRLKSKVKRAIKILADMGIDYTPQIYDPSATEESTAANNKEKTAESTVVDAVKTTSTKSQNSDSGSTKKNLNPDSDRVVAEPGNKNVSSKNKRKKKSTPSESALPASSSTEASSESPNKRPKTNQTSKAPVKTAAKTVVPAKAAPKTAAPAKTAPTKATISSAKPSSESVKAAKASPKQKKTAPSKKKP